MRFLHFILSSGLLISLVLVVRTKFRKKLAPGVIYALWLIPLFRLLIPFTWEAPAFGAAAQVMNAPYELAEEIAFPKDTALWEPESNEETGKYRVNMPEKQTEAAKKEEVRELPQIHGEQLFICIWGLGSVILGSLTVHRNRRLKRTISSMKSTVSSEGLTICISEEISVPCLVGVMKPEILIPQNVFQDPQLYECALSHERAHYQQKDHLWTTLRILLCVVYWWNPFVWIAAKCVEEDAELACDARVLKDQTPEERRTYGYALLKILENAQEKKYRLCAATSLNGSKKSMKKRITEIAKQTNTKKIILMPLLIIMLLALLLGCTMPTQRSWIKTTAWENGQTEEAVYSEAEYSYVLQKDIKSILLYCEVYRQGELLERNVLSYGNVDEKRNTIKLRRESGILDEKQTLILEANGVGMGLEAPAAQYAKGEHGGTALQSKSGKIEIVPGTDLVLMADCYADEETKIIWYDCKELSESTEAEKKEILKDSPMVSLVRILFSDKEAEELSRTFLQEQAEKGSPNEENQLSDLETAITNSILENYDPNTSDGLFRTESHVILANEVQATADGNEPEEATVFLLALRGKYQMYQGNLETIAEECLPISLTFAIDEGENYILKEYWEPGVGSDYVKDVRGKFPGETAEDALYAEQYLPELKEESYQKAQAYFYQRGDLEECMEKLLVEISSGAILSTLEDAVAEHPQAYEELLGYGVYTLRYCFEQFLQGGQTDAKGKLMEMLCIEIMGNWGIGHHDVLYAAGQDWFDAFFDRTVTLQKTYPMEEIEKNYPAQWILLELLNEMDPTAYVLEN